MLGDSLIGMTISTVFALLIGLLLGAALAAAATWLLVRARYAAVLATAAAQRTALQERGDEQLGRLQDQRDRLAEQAAQLESLRERAIQDHSAQAALAPLAATIARVERQVGVLERDRVEQFGELGERLDQVHASTRALREQTASLAGSLNASNVRGLWGETQLRRVLEASGMLARCDFDEQVQAVSRHDADVRPDVVVRLPAGKTLVVDAKAPMSGFLDAQRPGLTPAQQTQRMAAHAAAVRRHVESLAAKDYWSAFEESPRLVVCFVPSEAVLAAALEHEPSLFEAAMRRHVALASPATLLALLRTVAHAWQQDALTTNARELLTLGRELHERLATLGRHVTGMGTSLRRSVEAYNSMVGTLESRVLVTTRRMHELDLAPDPGPQLPPVSATPRSLTAAELIDAELIDAEDALGSGGAADRDARHWQEAVGDAAPRRRRDPA